MKQAYYILSILMLFAVNILFSQAQSTHNNYITLPNIAILDIEPNTSDIVLEFEAPNEPGAKLVAVEGDSKWINYTATQTIGGSPKEITAQVSTETNIPGLTVELVISSYRGGGKGDLGTSIGKINLSTNAQIIISGIGGCYTRNGRNQGHEIVYNAEITDYSIFEIPGTTSMDIIFTISN